MKTTVVVLALAILIGLITGDRRLRLGRAPFRHAWVFPVAAILEIAPFLPVVRDLPGASALCRACTIAGFLLLLGGLLLNSRTAGVPLMAVAVALNLAVIAANFGQMPVNRQVGLNAGLSSYIETLDDPGPQRHKLETDASPLRLLDDRIVLVPGEIISVGDVLLALGAGWWVMAALGSRFVVSRRRVFERAELATPSGGATR